MYHRPLWIDQTLYYVDKANKKRLLLKLLNKNRVQNALVFTRTKSNANRLAKYLNEAGVAAGVIHGNKSQNARQQALLQFKEGKSRVLVATDIAARGIDVQELSHVFNYDIPNEAEVYVHRIGRTGRAGRQGTAIAFSDINEAEYIKSIEKLIRMRIPVQEDRSLENIAKTFGPRISNNAEIQTMVSTLIRMPVFAPCFTRSYFLAPIFCPVKVVSAME